MQVEDKAENDNTFENEATHDIQTSPIENNLNNDGPQTNNREEDFEFDPQEPRKNKLEINDT